MIKDDDWNALSERHKMDMLKNAVNALSEKIDGIQARISGGSSNAELLSALKTLDLRLKAVERHVAGAGGLRG